MRTSYSLDELQKKEMMQMIKSGKYSKVNIAKYFGLSLSTVWYYVDKKRRSAYHKKYYENNKKKIFRQMKIYAQSKKNKNT